MLYININREYAFKDEVYCVRYIDYTKFSFMKRICKKVWKEDCLFESGIDFSDGIFFYFLKYDNMNVPFDMKVDEDINNTFGNELIMDFKKNNIIEKIKNSVDIPLEKDIIDRLFDEVQEKLK